MALGRSRDRLFHEEGTRVDIPGGLFALEYRQETDASCTPFIAREAHLLLQGHRQVYDVISLEGGAAVESLRPLVEGQQVPPV